MTSKPMSRRKAVRIAVEAMKLEARKYAFDANLYERFGGDSPTMVNAAKKHAELLEAMSMLSTAELPLSNKSATPAAEKRKNKNER